MEQFPPSMVIRKTSDADVLAMFMRAQERVDRRLEVKGGLADLYTIADQSVSVLFGERLAAIATFESATDATILWRREEFPEDMIRMLVSTWTQFMSTVTMSQPSTTTT